MHIQLLTLGSRGDVQPYVALGAALKARGHEVTVTTGQGFDDMIEAQGLTSAPISDDIRELIQDPMIQEALRSFSGKVKAWRRYHWGELRSEAMRQLDESWAITREIRPSMLVYHLKMGGAPVFGDALQIPAIASFLLPGFVSTSAYPSPMLPVSDLGKVGNRLTNRAMLGVARLLFGGLLARWQRSRLKEVTARHDPFEGYDPSGRPPLRLHAYSRHIVPRPDDWAEREQVTGYWFLDDEPGWQPPAGMMHFLDAGPPPVYVGFGSMPAADAGGMTRLVVEALERSGHRGVLATGWGGLEATDVPDTVHMLDTAPHSWLFPRCAAIVHHGGAGTTHEGLRWGRPSIVCPVGVDQPFWGRRVAALGAGPTPLPQKRLTADALSLALQAIRDPAMIARAEEIGVGIRSEGGAREAAVAIERQLAR